MIIYIYDEMWYHWEIMESVIQKYDLIIKKNKTPEDVIHLTFHPHESFRKYITGKYPEIKLNKPEFYDYSIKCTEFKKNENLLVNDGKHFYISHEVENKEYNDLPCIFFITPLCGNDKYFYADILPFSDQKIKTDIPIFVIQGNISDYRQCFDFLENILKGEYSHPFRIKIIGRGDPNPRFDKYKDLLTYKTHLNFIDFHKEFLDCYGIIKLVTRKTNPHYYNYRLTSSINYARAYKLVSVIDEELSNIYDLSDVETFHDENDIVDAFRRALDKFYINKQISQ